MDHERYRYRSYVEGKHIAFRFAYTNVTVAVRVRVLTIAVRESTSSVPHLVLTIGHEG